MNPGRYGCLKDVSTCLLGLKHKNVFLMFFLCYGCLKRRFRSILCLLRVKTFSDVFCRLWMSKRRLRWNILCLLVYINPLKGIWVVIYTNPRMLCTKMWCFDGELISTNLMHGTFLEISSGPNCRMNFFCCSSIKPNL